MMDSIFRSLDPVEEADFRQWARANFVPGTEPSPVWHPVVRDEWAKQQALSTNETEAERREAWGK